MVEDHNGEKSEKSFKWPENHPDERETKNKGNLYILKKEIFELSTGQVARQT
jgi:hypothetical protein